MLSRRTFVTGAGSFTALTALAPTAEATNNAAYQLVAQTDRSRILRGAQEALSRAPVTVTSSTSPRTPGGPHDFFSEADYFWPDPLNPNGPYINRDGQSNPANFNEHRKAMIALSVRMPALTAAWVLTGRRKYGEQACAHLRAWFVAPP